MNKANKKTVKKVKLVVKGAMKKTGVFAKKANKEAGKMAKVIQKKWKESKPQREKLEKDIGKAAKKGGKKGMELFKSGLKNSFKIGGDIAKVIEKDVKEIYNESNKKKSKK